MAISFVSAGSSYSSTSSSTTITLNKPASIVSGDYLIAVIAFFPNQTGSGFTVTPPSGWSQVAQQYKYDASQSNDVQIVVLSKTATGSEPATWTATLSSSSGERVAFVNAYRGAQGFLTTGTSTAGSTTSYSTATINNSESTAWRITAGCYGSGTANFDIDSNEVSLRKLQFAESGTGATEAAIWDSNGTIATGNTSRTISRSAVWGVSASFIGALQAAISVTNAPAGAVTATAVANAVKKKLVADPVSATCVVNAPKVKVSVKPGQGAATGTASNPTRSSLPIKNVATGLASGTAVVNRPPTAIKLHTVGTVTASVVLSPIHTYVAAIDRTYLIPVRKADPRVSLLIIPFDDRVFIVQREAGEPGKR